MFSNLAVLRMAHEMGQHAGLRQAMVARNVANADTPGYRPRDAISFAESLRAAPEVPLKTTRAAHIPGAVTRVATDTRDVSGPVDPSGNAVSLDQEMLRAAEIRQEHETALAIYRSALDILRTSLGRGR